MRTDIQGLRAIAVLAVLAFHLWPHVLTGGYVGVDVFFVISGFLITGHLLRSPVTGVTSLLRFWARRVRRLIPAATIVLLATLAASAIWVPATALRDVARESIAAVAYVENWLLARTGADYLAEGQAPSPVQHYWSLSIEEQFYLVWPIVLGATAVLVARTLRSSGGMARRQVVEWLPSALIATILVVSLWWSSHLTAVSPSTAYFVSAARAWELALGGLLAAALSNPVVRGRAERSSAFGIPVRPLAAWLGLVMIAWAVLTFDSETAFPGVTALVPTLGTALMIGAAADGLPLGPGRLLALRPVQWVGEVSYGAYLWHWPLVVIAPFALGRALSLVDTVVMLGMSLALAAASLRFVEGPLRWHPALRRSLPATFGMLLACGLAVAGVAWALLVHVGAAERRALADFPEQAAALEHCLGAGVARDPSCAQPDLVMPPEVAANDKPAVYADGCWNNTPFTSRNTCSYGAASDAAATARIAIVGNSHAGHWLPAFDQALNEHGWRLTTYLQSVCYTVEQPIEFPAVQTSENCQRLNRWAMDAISTGGYDLVVMSNRTHQPLDGVPDAEQTAVAEAAYAKTLAEFTDAGIPVLVLRDTPAMREDVPDCLALHADDVDACATDREVALEPDPLVAAAARDETGLVSVLDISETMCDADTCDPVIGGLIAYFDHGHLTATFARTLTPEVTSALEKALATTRY